MTSLRNTVTLIGNLGKDPEVRNFESGKKKATFSIATNENFRNQSGEKTNETQWHTIVAWGHLAEIALKYLKKGREVAIEGRIVYRSYETNKGEKRNITEINAHQLLLLNKQ